ncbi:MAG: hypothetical protein QGI09_09290 [Dehalococcoidia bacterium]|jgi:hypothetical protein|nr:hypothetical protein [Dehalococcoidia bacterium]
MDKLEIAERERSWVGTFVVLDGSPAIHCLMVDDEGIPFWHCPYKPTTQFIRAALDLLKKDLKEGRIVPCHLNPRWKDGKECMKIVKRAAHPIISHLQYGPGARQMKDRMG